MVTMTRGVDIDIRRWGLRRYEDDGDDDSTVIIIEDNGPIEGGDGDGIEVDMFTGGDIPGSEGQQQYH